jgi:hypothetical protein
VRDLKTREIVNPQEVVTVQIRKEKLMIIRGSLLDIPDPIQQAKTEISPPGSVKTHSPENRQAHFLTGIAIVAQFNLRQQKIR